MADFLRMDRTVVVDVMQEVGKAALLLCLLWYAGQVVAHQLVAPARPASDVYWGSAEADPRDVPFIGRMA